VKPPAGWWIPAGGFFSVWLVPARLPEPRSCANSRVGPSRVEWCATTDDTRDLADMRPLMRQMVRIRRPLP